MSEDILARAVRAIEKHLATARECHARGDGRHARSFLNSAQEALENWRSVVGGTEYAEDFANQIKDLAFKLYIFPNGLEVEA